MGKLTVLGPRRTNHHRHDEPRLRPIKSDILAGWFGGAVLTVAAWAIVFWFVRWAWNYWG